VGDGRPRARTARHLDGTARIVRGLLAGEKVDFSGELSSCKGYRLRLVPVSDSPLTISSFGAAAVRVAGRRADRMLLNMVTPESLARLRQQMAAAASDCGRPAPKVAAWLTCAVDPEPEARQQLTRAIVGYLPAPGYAEMISEAGFAELVEFARTRPHPKELVAAMPDELLAAIGLVGGEEAIAARRAQYREAGADEVCLVPATAGDPGGIRSLTAMAARLPG